MMNQNNLLQEFTSVRSQLEQNTIGIILGERLTLDTAAAGLALYLSLKQTGKNVQIVSKKEPSVEISNLVGIDKIKTSFSGSSNKVVVSLPYKRGEIGKVSYKEEQDRINFYLTAVEGKSITPYETSDIDLMWEGATPGVIVVLGASSASQVRDFVDLSKDAVKVINIDTQGESFGDISIVDQSFSSVSEIIAKMIRELRLPMDIDVAQNLLDGILHATRNFTKPNASPYAFEAAGQLLQMGATRGDNRNSGRGNPFSRENNLQQNQPQGQNQNRNRNRNQGNVSRNEMSRGRQQDNGDRQGQNDDRRPSDSFSPRPQNEMSKNENFDTSPKNLDSNQGERTDMSPAAAASSSDSVPDDWLMPKVFKGSQDINDLK